MVPVDFILAAEPDHDRPEAHRALAANAFAQAEALLRGRSEAEVRAEMAAPARRRRRSTWWRRIGFAPASGRPTRSCSAGSTPFSLGRLIALYEHKVAVQGCLWGIDSFDQWGVELGKQLAGGHRCRR